MKKWLIILLALALLLFGSSCRNAEEDDEVAEEAEETMAVTIDDELYVALVTDTGSIDDNGFNQACWEAVDQFADEYDLEFAYYRPAGDTTEELTKTIEIAIKEGADALVCPGNVFEEAIYELQNEYPDIIFLMIDAEPYSPAGQSYAAADNVHCIIYQEEQAGYVAGYAAVAEGLTKLGFVGGVKLAPVIRYGHGFIQGADQAAQKLDKQVEIEYWYSGSWDPSDEVYAACSQWYAGGTQAVFACGGELVKSVIRAAEEGKDRYVIGVDVDQAALSDVVLTSAMKDIKVTAYESLCAMMENDWAWPSAMAGSTYRLGAVDKAVALPTAPDSWRFKTFTKENYDELLQSLVDGSVIVSDDTAAVPQTSRVNVTFK